MSKTHLQLYSILRMYIEGELIVIIILQRNILLFQNIQLQQLVAYLILYAQSIEINLATYVDGFHCFAYTGVCRLHIANLD